MLSFTGPVAAAKRVALVIGNAEYQFVTPLTNPINDAALMEEALKNAGFEVIRKDNLDQRGMKLALVEFSRLLKQGAEAGMFYYAGHGIEVDGKNYLVPIDSNMQSKEEADVFNFDVNSFLAMMENSGVPFNILVLDACRNNPFRSLRTTGGGLAPMRAPVGSYVAYATAPGSVAADGEGKNSPFTEALAETMAVPGLALEEVFKQTRTKVRAATGGAQVPFDSSAIEGDFYFTSTTGNYDNLESPAAVAVIAEPNVAGDAYAQVRQFLVDEYLNTDPKDRIVRVVRPYPQSVNYYGKVRSREFVIKDKLGFFDRWQEGSLSLDPDSLSVEPMSNGHYEVHFIAHYNWVGKPGGKDEDKTLTGTVAVRLGLQFDPTGLIVVSEDSEPIRNN